MTTLKPNEFSLTRVYDAPVKMVWDAWHEPEQVAQWWGPRGFTITHLGKELRVGGYWKYTMHGPDGTNYPNHTVYHEVEPLKRMVYDHGGNEDQPPLFRVTVTFTDLGNQTQLDFVMACPTAEAATEMKQFIKAAGGNATWDRLAEYLEKQSTQTDVFVINRTFDTDINTMFDMWTVPEHLVGWSGPTGSQMEYLQVDIRPGGGSFYKMTTEGPMGTLYGKVQYLQLERPNLLVYTQQFCDAEGNITRHPLAPTWPETKLTTVRFTEEGPGQTRVTLSWKPYGDATAEEIATFAEARAGMTGGWTGSFDRLDIYLDEVRVSV